MGDWTGFFGDGEGPLEANRVSPDEFAMIATGAMRFDDKNYSGWLTKVESTLPSVS